MKLGSKIENLKTMRNAGLPVPAFYALPFAELISDTDRLHREIENTLYLKPQPRSKCLKAAVRELVMDDFTLPEAEGRYAVRSSHLSVEAPRPKRRMTPSSSPRL